MSKADDAYTLIITGRNVKYAREAIIELQGYLILACSSRERDIAECVCAYADKLCYDVERLSARITALEQAAEVEGQP